jgi:hypothetical protein
MTEWLQTGFRLVIEFIEHLQNVTTNNYDSLSELHTPKFSVTTAHKKVFSVFNSRCLVTGYNTTLTATGVVLINLLYDKQITGV